MILLNSSTSFLSIGKNTLKVNTFKFLQHQMKPNHTTMQETKRVIEVEQKFSTLKLDAVLENLHALKFSPEKEVRFMDWYFDRADLVLCTQDHWLRYRHLSKSPDEGHWQLKKGCKVTGGVTVYEELEGGDAINMVKSLMDSNDMKKTIDKIDNSSSWNEYKIPNLPDDISSYKLKPFARIETRRSTWKKSMIENNNIVVDIDGTDFGYMVGEVEIVVNRDEDVEEAQKSVNQFIRDITNAATDDDCPPALGKLETYLIQNRPDVYDACTSSGVMHERHS